MLTSDLALWSVAGVDPESDPNRCMTARPAGHPTVNSAPSMTHRFQSNFVTAAY